jgi:hypothetical protein
MKKVRFKKNGFETELSDKVAEVYKKKGRAEIVNKSASSKQSTGESQSSGESQGK